MTRLFPHGRDQGNEGEEGLGVVEEEEVVIFMVEGLAVGWDQGTCIVENWTFNSEVVHYGFQIWNPRRIA